MLLFLGGLLLLSIAVLYLVEVWLPQWGIAQAGPRLSVGPLPLPGQLPDAQRRILIAPSQLAPRPGFWLRPFGLGREGLPALWWYLGSFISVLVLAIIAVFLAPKRAGVLARVVGNGWGQRVLALVIGLLGYLGLALLALLIFVNVVGWPILTLLIIGVYAATAFGLAAVALALGANVCRFLRLDSAGPLFHLGVGVVLLFLASLAPYLGWLVIGASATLGFGAVLWTRGGDTSGWSLDEVVD
jgi:hypothetical protein